MTSKIVLFVLLVVAVWAIDIVVVHVIEPRLTTEMAVQQVNNDNAPIETLRCYTGSMQNIMHGGSTVITIVTFFMIFGKDIRNKLFPDPNRKEYRK